MSGVQQAIDKAGGKKPLADLFGVTEQAINRFLTKGYFPLERARQVADVYGIPLADMVRDDIALALRSASS
ncbi:MAG: YdaS family helix-turn-helix protein [Sphingomicrobium sp.]